MLFERAECRYNLQSLGKSRRLPTAELKEGECYSPGHQSKIMPPTMREDNAEFDDIDSGLDICSGCSEEASKKPTGFVCCGLDSKCSARWCDECVEIVKKEMATWGDREQAYCIYGEKVAGYVTKRAASHRDFHFGYIGRRESCKFLLFEPRCMADFARWLIIGPPPGCISHPTGRCASYG
jgi:hypothetical protein